MTRSIFLLAALTALLSQATANPRIDAVPVKSAEGMGPVAARAMTPTMDAGTTWLSSLGYLQEDSWFHYCGGALVSADLVVTAASCIDPKESPKDSIRVGGDDLAKFSDFKELGIKSIMVHPMYNSLTGANDIALIRLNGTAPGPYMDVYIGGPLESVGAKAEIIGWGLLSAGDGTSAVQRAPAPVAMGVGCKAVDSEMCAGVRGPKGQCFADQGGPLFANGETEPTLLGISTTGPACASNTDYGLYTQASQFVAWISDYIDSADTPDISVTAPLPPTAEPPSVIAPAPPAPVSPPPAPEPTKEIVPTVIAPPPAVIATPPAVIATPTPVPPDMSTKSVDTSNEMGSVEPGEIPPIDDREAVIDLTTATPEVPEVEINPEDVMGEEIKVEDSDVITSLAPMPTGANPAVRGDGRCGLRFPLPGSFAPGECDSLGDKPCCSTVDGQCTSVCEGVGVVDFRKGSSEMYIMAVGMPWRDDMRCGPGYPAPSTNKPAQCSPYSDHPCCNLATSKCEKVASCALPRSVDFRKPGAAFAADTKPTIAPAPRPIVGQPWRTDFRCGKGWNAPGTNQPAQCDPKSKDRFCCGTDAYCGGEASCAKPGSIDYRNLNGIFKPRADGRCGAQFTINIKGKIHPGPCDGKSAKFCCSPKGVCGGAAACVGSGAKDFRPKTISPKPAPAPTRTPAPKPAPAPAPAPTRRPSPKPAPVKPAAVPPTRKLTIAEIPGRVRSDGRCGSSLFGSDNRSTAICNPYGIWPCCSADGQCGATARHCSGAGTVDYRKYVVVPVQKRN